MRGEQAYSTGEAAEILDHPRMRGEQIWRTFYRVRMMGSPPHARGAVSIGFHNAPDSGITPACAGSRMSSEASAI